MLSEETENQFTSKIIKMMEIKSDLYIKVEPLPSGYSKDISGQVKINFMI